MRKDLNKVLCERPRHNHEDKFHNYRHHKKFKNLNGEELENLPAREGMKVRYKHGGWDKNFNEHLSPLKGIIRKSVGKKWDKVFSELCQVFDRRSVINQHIVQHLRDFIAIETFLDGTDIWVKERWRNTPIADGWYEFFVDPRTGIVRRNRHFRSYRQARKETARREAAEKAKVHRVIDDKTELFLVNGVWFIAEVRDTPSKGYQVKKTSTFAKNMTYYVTEYVPVFDVVLGRQVTYPHFRKYAISKRTASHKELKKYGIVKD
jgi:hypothetical protein